MATKIAIVGAGCAGLGAATTLVEQNDAAVSVTLLEANDWIGGRARTWPDPLLPLDLGPQYIQDPAVNPWARIAEKRGYEYEQASMDSQYRMLIDGNWTNVEFNSEISKMNDALSAGYETATGFRNAPVLKPDAAALFAGQQAQKLSLGSNSYGAIVESAEPWQYVARDQDRQEKVDYVPNWYVKGGLGSMVSKYGIWLLDTYRNLSFIDHCAVTDIRDADEKVSILASDNDMGDYDYCIVTIPSREIPKISFEPNLPGTMVRACDFIRLGSYKKVAFQPVKFPQGDGNTIDEGCEYFIFDPVHDGVWEYFRLPTDPTILICVTAGDFAAELDAQSPEVVTGWVLGLLDAAYSGAESDFTPQRDEWVVTNWTDTPHIHGAYSYTRYDGTLDPDNPVPLEARKEIAKPHGRIHFAGEATWKKAYGTIHGAYRSGERAANEILQRLRQSD